MNALTVHVLVNHYPVIGTFLGFLVLAAGIAFAGKKWVVASLTIFAVSAASALPAFFTGLLTQKIFALDSTLLPPGLLISHRELAMGTLFCMILLGVYSVKELLNYRKTGELSDGSGILPFAMSIIICGLFFATARAGRQIYDLHPEEATSKAALAEHEKIDWPLDGPKESTETAIPSSH